MTHTDTAVLFDLDGTLADTLTDLADTTNTILHRHGFPTHPTDAYRHFVGNGARRQLERALGNAATPERTDALFREFLVLYNETCLKSVRVYDGIPAVLDALEERGAALAVVTNKPDEQAHRIVRYLFGEGRFSAVCGGRDDRPKKPDPTLPRTVLRQLQVQPDRTLFVGDSDVDIETAHNAGLFGIGVAWGFRGEAELAAAGAPYIAHHPFDIVTAFDRHFDNI